MEKMCRQRLAVGVDRDALAVSRKVMPIKKHRPERGQQGIGDVASAGDVVVIGLGPQTTQHGDARTQHIHGMRVCGHELERLLHFRGQAAQAEEAHFVCGEF